MLAINRDELIAVAVQGQVAHPVGRATAYRVGHDGVPRVLPGTGGIVLNRRIGDPCVGLAGDHIEPGVALHNNGREVVGPRDGPNNALITYACVGNAARVTTGPCRGAVGVVTGKHGGINHVIVDFPTQVLMRLRIGDQIQIVSIGQGMRLTEHPQITVLNCAPRLLARWGILLRHGRLEVPVTHLVPSRLMGSGLGKDNAWRGDYDIQLTDRVARDRHGLGSLRFGDMVAIKDADAVRGPSYRGGHTTIGVIVHGDSIVSGHGPGVTALLTGPAAVLRPTHCPQANLAEILRVRHALPPRQQSLFVERDSRPCIFDHSKTPRLPFDKEEWS